jgi:hypothetical protein
MVQKSGHMSAQGRYLPRLSANVCVSMLGTSKLPVWIRPAPAVRVAPIPVTEAPVSAAWNRTLRLRSLPTVIDGDRPVRPFSRHVTKADIRSVA